MAATYEQMLQKLDEFYNREEQIQLKIKELMLELEQIKDDKEMLQTLIMYEANKQIRKQRVL